MAVAVLVEPCLEVELTEKDKARICGPANLTSNSRWSLYHAAMHNKTAFVNSAKKIYETLIQRPSNP